MARLKIGDRVDCRIKSNIIINPYQNDFDEIKTFEIISVDEYGYYIYVPHYYYLSGTSKIDHKVCKDLHLDSKFLGDSTFYIRDTFIYKIHSIIDGCTCKKCNHFFYMSKANQRNGSFICWSCRNLL